MRPNPSGSALGPAGSSRAWRRLRAYVLARDAYRCQRVTDAGTGARCGAPATTAGHVVSRAEWPRGLPGVDDPANLRAECAACNYGAGATYGNHRRSTLNASRDW